MVDLVTHIPIVIEGQPSNAAPVGPAHSFAERNPETSPLRKVYADWEARLVEALRAEWQRKVNLLVIELARRYRKVAVAPLPSEFWAAWSSGYSEVMTPYLEEAVRISVAAEAANLRSTMAFSLDVGALDGDIADWAWKHSGQLISKRSTLFRQTLTGRDIRQVRQTIGAWVDTGQDFPALVAAINRTINNPTRAAMIAATESTRAYAVGQQMAWDEAGFIKYNRWQTASDELVCPVCAPLDGQIAELGALFGSGVSHPPAHVNCRCWLTPVTDRAHLAATQQITGAGGASPLAALTEPQPSMLSSAPEGMGQLPPRQTAWEHRPTFDGQVVNNQGRWGMEARAAFKEDIVDEIASRATGSREDVSTFIKQWAHSSNGADMRSLSIQAAAERQFAFAEMSEWQALQIDELMEQAGQAAARSLHLIWDITELTDAQLAAIRERVIELTRPMSEGLIANSSASIRPLFSDDVLDKYLRAMYDRTQEQLAQAGIKEVTLYRGYAAPMRNASIGDVIDIDMNALSSWSSDFQTAANFAGSDLGTDGVVLKIRVPVERVVGTFRTGFGCADEWEYVIGGGSDVLEDRATIAFLRKVTSGT